MTQRRSLVSILSAVAVGIPGVCLYFSHLSITPPLMALVAGVAILGAAFLLLWACDAAQADISQALALAVVALIAVMPEYAVDMYFTWQAGRNPASDYAQYAVANMTGANRLLVGVGWAVIAMVYWLKTRKSVRLDPQRRTEILFLGLATVYAFVIPIKGSLAWYDGLVFLGLYVWYLRIASRRACTESEAFGPAQWLVSLPKSTRRLATGALFLFAAAVIVTNAEGFSEGLIATGALLHINKFLLVQWLAPIASEAPEFLVAIMFALRGQPGLALGSLLSSKLNQWTLLVGMIPAVYGVSHGSFQHPIPMGALQMHEILLTAAQSLLAVVIVSVLRLSVGQALLLFGLFIGQFITPWLVGVVPAGMLGAASVDQVHLFFSALYLVAALTLILDQPDRFKGMWLGARVERSRAAVER